MKITIYELLGMVKDGKAPKKIKYDGKLYEFDDSKDNYYENETCSINWDYVAIYCLNETVEIIEEPKGIPEKLDIGKMLQTKKWKRDKKTWETINSIIDYLESKGDE